MRKEIPRHPHADHVFFLSLAVLLSVTAFAGFSFTYFGPVLRGSYPPAGAPLHIHGWSFFLWYLLLPLQAALITRRRHTLHMALGRLSVVLALVMTLTGVLVLSVRVEEAIRTNNPDVWVPYGPLILSNLVLFVVFYAASIRMAVLKRLEVHKRLMVVAATAVLGAGFFRLILFLSGFHPLSLPAGVLGSSLVLLIAMTYEWITRRSVHAVYWIGLVALLGVEVLLLPQLNGDLVLWIDRGLAAIGQDLGIFYRPEPTIQF